jgi:hypothetical protein
MPTALINQQPGLNNINHLYHLEDLEELNNLPKYDEIDEDIIINEVISIDELPPPEYIP